MGYFPWKCHSACTDVVINNSNIYLSGRGEEEWGGGGRNTTLDHFSILPFCCASLQLIEV